jgi:NAD(P)-dependent dehydrogenase (short-subunit alcohol dehydrogenase family)
LQERLKEKEKHTLEMHRRPAIDGKVAIVSGASSGIGESMAREFAQAGAITVLSARRVERLKRLENEITEMGGQALAIPTSVSLSSKLFELLRPKDCFAGRPESKCEIDLRMLMRVVLCNSKMGARIFFS